MAHSHTHLKRVMLSQLLDPKAQLKVNMGFMKTAKRTCNHETYLEIRTKLIEQ